MPKSTQQVAEELSWAMDSWKSIEIRSSDQFFNTTSGSDPRQAPSGRLVEHYIETSTGRRLYDRIMQLPSGVQQHSTSYCDSNKCAEVEYPNEQGLKHTQVVIKRAFGTEDIFGCTFRPTPLCYYYVGKTPLPEAILKAPWAGEDHVLGRDCDNYLFTNVKWGSVPGDVIYSLDRATSVPLKVGFFRDQKARERNEPDSVWEAQSFDQVEGRHLPLNSRLTTYDPVRDAVESTGVSQDRSVTMTRIYKVDSLSFDKHFPESTFWPKIDENASVFDNINNTHQFPKSSKAAYTELQRASAESPPVLALPESDYSTMLSGTGVVLGIALLSAALLLTLRQRAKT